MVAALALLHGAFIANRVRSKRAYPNCAIQGSQFDLYDGSGDSTGLGDADVIAVRIKSATRIAIRAYFKPAGFTGTTEILTLPGDAL